MVNDRHFACPLAETSGAGCRRAAVSSSDRARRGLGPSADLVTYACGLLGIAPPPEVPFDQAVLSPMAREFWADNKRVGHDRIKTELGVRLAFPDYRTGLDDIFAKGAI